MHVLQSCNLMKQLDHMICYKAGLQNSVVFTNKYKDFDF